MVRMILLSMKLQKKKSWGGAGGTCADFAVGPQVAKATATSAELQRQRHSIGARDFERDHNLATLITIYCYNCSNFIISYC